MWPFTDFPIFYVAMIVHIVSSFNNLSKCGGVGVCSSLPKQKVAGSNPDVTSPERGALRALLSWVYAIFSDRFSRMIGKPLLIVKWGGSLLKDLESFSGLLQPSCKNPGKHQNNVCCVTSAMEEAPHCRLYNWLVQSDSIHHCLNQVCNWLLFGRSFWSNAFLSLGNSNGYKIILLPPSVKTDDFIFIH